MVVGIGHVKMVVLVYGDAFRPAEQGGAGRRGAAVAVGVKRTGVLRIAKAAVGRRSRISSRGGVWPAIDAVLAPGSDVDAAVGGNGYTGQRTRKIEDAV